MTKRINELSGILKTSQTKSSFRVRFKPEDLERILKVAMTEKEAISLANSLNDVLYEALGEIVFMPSHLRQEDE